LVELQQVVVLIPNDASIVGPTTLAFPGYALLLIFVGLKGAISYPSVEAIPTDSENTFALSILISSSKARTLRIILSS